MDWKDALKNKAKELNIKEETDGHKADSIICNDRSNSSRSDNSIILHPRTSSTNNSVSSRSGSILHSKKIQPINNVIKKGGKGMITVEGALKDLEAIEKEATDNGAKAVVKALKVVVKFLSTIRSNQLLTDEEKVNIRKAKEARAIKEVK